jgi:hypothetical protein
LIISHLATVIFPILLARTVHLNWTPSIITRSCHIRCDYWWSSLLQGKSIGKLEPINTITSVCIWSYMHLFICSYNLDLHLNVVLQIFKTAIFILNHSFVTEFAPMMSDSKLLDQSLVYLSLILWYFNAILIKCFTFFSPTFPCQDTME